MSYMIRPPYSDADLSNRTAMLVRLDNARDALEASYTNWQTLTAAQKDAAMRLTIRLVAALLRVTLNEYDSAGV